LLRVEPLALGALVLEEVGHEGVPAHDLAGAGHPEPLLGPLMRLDLWHRRCSAVCRLWSPGAPGRRWRPPPGRRRPPPPPGSVPARRAGCPWPASWPAG